MLYKLHLSPLCTEMITRVCPRADKGRTAALDTHSVVCVVNILGMLLESIVIRHEYVTIVGYKYILLVHMYLTLALRCIHILIFLFHHVHRYIPGLLDNSAIVFYFTHSIKYFSLCVRKHCTLCDGGLSHILFFVFFFFFPLLSFFSIFTSFFSSLPFFSHIL